MPNANFFGENGNGFFMNVDVPKLTKNRVLVKVISTLNLLFIITFVYIIWFAYSYSYSVCFVFFKVGSFSLNFAEIDFLLI